MEKQTAPQADEPLAIAKRCLQISVAFSVTVIVLALVSTCGWLFQLVPLQEIFPGQMPTTLGASLGFLCCASALLLLRYCKPSEHLRSVGIILSSAGIVIGATALLRVLNLWEVDVDEFLLRRDLGPIIVQNPGRMGANAALSLFSLAAAVLSINSRDHWKQIAVQALAVLAMFEALATICASIYGTPGFPGGGFGIFMPLTTGILSLFMSLAVLLAHPTRGIVGIITDQGPGGSLCRRVIPAVIPVAILLGYLRLWGQRLGWFDTTFGVTVMVLTMVSSFSALVVWHCRWLNQTSKRELKSLEALRCSESRTRLILDSAYDAFVITDNHGKILDWNKKAELLFGWERLEILGCKLIGSIIPDPYRSQVAANGQKFNTPVRGMQTFFNGPDRHIETVLTRRDGSEFLGELAFFRIIVNEEDQFCAFIQDISPRKEAETEIRLLNDQLTVARDQALEASRLKSEFLANMSHEIRTPMNAVIGVSDLLKRTPLNTEQKKFVDLIVNSGHALLEIINDILQFSKIEAGKLEILKVDFDLVSTVEGAAELLADKARQKGLTFTTFIEPNVPVYVRGDPQRLRQVLLNLISNAIKFTEHGSVLVRLSLESYEEDRCVLRFTVSDTGVGIASSSVGRLFSPFTQVDGSITRKQGGTGLGLSITSRLVSLMGGTIDVTTAEDKGSSFSFALPFVPIVAPETKRLRMPVDMSDMRILLVGLSDQESDILCAYCGAWEASCVAVRTGGDAVAAIASAADSDKPVNAVLSTMNLADMNAFDLAKLVRQGSGESIQLVLLAAIDELGQVDRAMSEGFVAYLSRPIKQSSLYNCLVGLMQEDPFQQTFAELGENQTWVVPKGRYILLAEDNPVNQDVARLQLAELGFEVLIVPNGAEAVVASADPDCAMVLMDCQMPVMDGFKATQLIRAREGKTGLHVPIVAITAHAMEGDRETCIAVGMDDYASKPVTVSRLREVVHKWFPQDCEMADGLAERVRAAEPEEKSDCKVQMDLVDFRALVRQHGRAAAIRLMNLFVSSSSKLLQRLDVAIAARECNHTKSLAHELKGACALLEIEPMTSACRVIEAAALQEEWTVAEDAKAALVTCFEGIICQWNQAFGQNGSKSQEMSSET